ncbi:MAG: type II toxin-antitoxin system RelE/ParE family toxin [Flavobacteriales bacterium]|nr:type II toxin-antitoxin system RelE/ParE family toxin [Flavobacteriales bacterium]
MVKQVFRISWDREALDQLKAILDYLSKQSAKAPGIVKLAIVSRIELIRNNPLIFEIDKLKDPPQKEFRAFVVFSYRISYQINTDTSEIRILRIRHTSREPLGY